MSGVTPAKGHLTVVQKLTVAINLSHFADCEPRCIGQALLVIEQNMERAERT